MMLTLLPSSLFGRLMAALLSVVGVTAVIMVILVGRERQDIAFRRSDAGSVVELVAATSSELARLSQDARAAELARLRAESLTVERGPPSRPPRPPQQDPEQAAQVLAARLGRELGRQFKIDIRGAQPSAADVIRVLPGRRFRGPGPGPPDDGGGPGGFEPRPPPNDVAAGDVRARRPQRAGFRELDIGVILPDGERITYRTDVPGAEPPLPRGIFYQLLLVGAGLAVVLYAMTRTIVGPLSALARAAEAVGRGVRQAPLEETGAREIREATRAFNTMQERLHRYLDSRTRVLAAMSHDLRTPLTRLRLRVESLDDVELRERFITDLDEMNHMVTGALNLFKGSSEEEPTRLIDVGQLLEELRAQFAEIGASVAIEGAVREPIAVKPQALKRCLTNLLSNAIQYGERATVVIDDQAAELVLRVVDEGPGIPEAALEQVFEPFFRLESSRNADTGGTGLGLSIARDIAQAHGGSLQLRNRLPHGLEAVLRLP
jgi:signal transduction histidine kinase